ADEAPGPQVAGQSRETNVNQARKREPVLVVQLPEPRPGRLLAEQDRHEVPLVHVRIGPGVPLDVDEPGHEHYRPNAEEEHAGANVRSACRAAGREIRYPDRFDRLIRTTQGNVRHGGASHRTGPSVPPQGEAAEVEAEAGRRPRRGPGEDPRQDPRAQPILDRAEEVGCWAVGWL